MSTYVNELFCRGNMQRPIYGRSIMKMIIFVIECRVQEEMIDMKLPFKTIVVFLAVLMLVACEAGKKFDKDKYLEKCNLSMSNLQDLILSPGEEDSLAHESYMKPYQKPQREEFLKKGDLSSCMDLLRYMADYLFSLRSTDSLLVNHYYASALSQAESPYEVIGLTLSYAKSLPPSHRKIIGEVSWPYARRINDTLAAQAVFRIVEGVVGKEGLILDIEKKSVSEEDMQAIVSWCKIGLPYAETAFGIDDPNYAYLLEYLVRFSWRISDPSSFVYADSLIAYDKRTKHQTMLFHGPIYHRYIDAAIKNSDYRKAKEILYLYKPEYLDSTSLELGYIPLISFLPDRTQKKIQTRNLTKIDSLFQSLSWSVSGYKNYDESQYGRWLIERARFSYLNKERNYSSWLNSAFYTLVEETFPLSKYLEYLISPDYRMNYKNINLLSYQYNNNDPKNVYDAILYIKAASETIPSSISWTIREFAEQKIINYVDSIRTYGIPSMPGVESEYLENAFGSKIKAILKKNILSYSDIKSQLKADEVAIEFYSAPSFSPSGGNIYRAAVLYSEVDEPIIIELGSDQELRKLISADHFYENPDSYKIIWSPIEDVIGERNKIYFSMDGLLNMCNLPALMHPNGKILGDTYNFKQLSSTREILNSKDTVQCTAIALFGGIDYSAEYPHTQRTASAKIDHTQKTILRSFSRSDFCDLPYTKVEVDHIMNKARENGMEVSCFSGREGTEEAFKSLSGRDVSIIHLATHGFYYSKKQPQSIDFINTQMVDDEPLSRCGLLLAGSKYSWKKALVGDNDNDGILFGYEISRLDFSKVDLIVLSACKTALGDIDHEGVAGLRRAFKLAGAKSILITLNDVDDEATSFFMSTFYENYFDNKDKYQAFSNAINRMRSSKKFSDPKYWSMFVLID